MKNFIQRAKEETLEESKNNIVNQIDNFSTSDLRNLNMNNYINEKLNYSDNLFVSKGNQLFNNLGRVIVTQDLYNSVRECLKLEIKNFTQVKLNEKYDKAKPWPKNVQELLIEQKINKLEKNRTYLLYTSEKRSYEIIAKNETNITIPRISGNLYYLHEELPCWRNSGGLVYSSSNTPIDSTFNPNSFVLTLSPNNVYKYNWEEGGHRTFFGGGKPPRPQQKSAKLSFQIPAPWTIISYNISGSASGTLSNDKRSITVNPYGSSGSIQNILIQC